VPPRRPFRVGIVGFGFIGRALFERLAEDPSLEAAFVWNRSPERLAGLPAGLALADLAQARDRRPDLIVEACHPDVTQARGADFLAVADTMPLSVAALADAGLERRLQVAAAEHGTRLLIPHGALMATDNLVEGRENWAEVIITFEKHPAAIDYSASGLAPDGTGRRVVFDGTARDIGRLFPRNVNTMVTCALATVGLDRCRAVLISDPALTLAIADIQARGRDGSRLSLRKEQPMAGVSGTEMAASLLGSILRAGGGRPVLDFV